MSTATLSSEPSIDAAAPPSTGGVLRIALIGSGKMGQQHLRAIAKLPLARVVAVADPLANREELAELLPADARIFEDAAAMLVEARPDVVHIVTPPASHASLALMALRAG